MQNDISENTINTQNAEAEALQLQKKIGFLKTDLLVKQSENDQLKMLQDDLIIEMNHLKGQNYHHASIEKALKAEKEAEVTSLHTQLNNMQNGWQQKETAFQQKIKDLSNKNQILTGDNQHLQKQVSDLQCRNINNLRIEAIRGNSSTIVTKASRTQRLVLSFDMQTKENNNLRFVVMTPSGKQLNNDENKTLEVLTSPKDAETTQVKLTYLASDFEKGIYGLWVYRNQVLASSSQICLQ